MAWKNVQYENGKMRTSSGGSGGSSTFADLEDVDLSNLQDGQVPKYNATTGKWENANESGGANAVEINDSEGTAISNLDNIPLNTVGHVLLSSSIQPFGGSANMNVAYMKFGISNSSLTEYNTQLIIVTRGSTGETYVNSRWGTNSWVGWVKLSNTFEPTISNPSNGQTILYQNGSWINSAISAVKTYDSDTEITNLNNIPNNSAGHILLAQSISPFTEFAGNMNVAFLNIGYTSDNTKTLLFVCRLSTGVIYCNTRNGSSWTGWAQLNGGGSGGGVTDVQVDGQSVVNQGVANLTTPNLVGLPDVDVSNIADGQLLKWDATNSKWVNANELSQFADLTDVNITNPVDGQLIKYNATSGKWENASQMMFMASYGNTSFAEVLAAYRANAIVYCKASSSSNPASGAQLRQAFLAYVGGSTDNPTNFEFQYYRSVSSKSASQQGDQVYVYTISNNNTWTVTTRNTFTKIAVGTGLTSSYSGGTLTISLA